MCWLDCFVVVLLLLAYLCIPDVKVIFPRLIADLTVTRVVVAVTRMRKDTKIKFSGVWVSDVKSLRVSNCVVWLFRLWLRSW